LNNPNISWKQDYNVDVVITEGKVVAHERQQKDMLVAMNVAHALR
jgi:hypothetical protein